MSTFKEQLAYRTEVQHRLAVYEAAYSFLDDTFIPKDGRSTEKGLRVADCMVELVPPNVIEEVLRELAEGRIAELQAELALIENQPIVEKKNRKAAS